MAKRIIGIHGLANKPSENRLKEWWLNAMNEGLHYINSSRPVTGGEFELIYWADMMYVKPQSENESTDSPFYLKETYRKATGPTKEYKEGVLDWLRETASDGIDDVLDGIGLLDKVVRTRFWL